MKSIIETIVEGIVSIVAIVSSMLFVIGVMLIVFAPLWFPIIILLFIIRHW